MTTRDSKEARYVARHPERARAARQRYRNANREKITATQRAYKLRKAYGLTVAEVEAMWDAQCGHCALCERELVLFAGRTDPGKAYVDHDHETGAVRALLCVGCNTGLGSLQDDPELLRRAADYIERYK